MKPIRDYRVGARFIAINPLGADDEPEPDPATWKSVKMRLRKPSGRYLKMDLLLSPVAIEALGVERSPTVNLELPEMGIGGAADVLSIDPCPEIEPGGGSVVTGVFVQESEGNLLNVFLEGVEEPIGVTDNHPFFSVDRGEFIRAGDLRSGERLSPADERITVRVSRIERRPVDELVYNLQVNGQHGYHVGPLAALVHNTCPGFSDPAFGKLVHSRFLDALVAQTGTKKGDWIMRVGPSMNGVDATYRGSKRIGFKNAELKPRTDWSFKKFLEQLENWRQQGLRGRTQLWFYNEQGVIGSSGINY